MTLPFIADGYGLDRALGAMFCGAKHGETVSYQAGVAAKGGKRWGCVLCWLLGLLVERDHCLKATAEDGYPTSRPAALRAGLLLLVAAVLVWVAPLLLVRLFGLLVWAVLAEV